jgi:hypothetical protein
VAVTSHVYPQAIKALFLKTINLDTDTFKMGLCTGSAATWGSTQQAYQYVSSVTGAYTECSSSGYARVTLSSLSLAITGENTVWTCASPISFGSTITLTAASAFIYDSSIGSGDSSYPLIGIIDFGGSVTSSSGAWTYTVDPTNGLFVAEAT